MYQYKILLEIHDVYLTGMKILLEIHIGCGMCKVDRKMCLRESSVSFEPSQYAGTDGFFNQTVKEIIRIVILPTMPLVQ